MNKYKKNLEVLRRHLGRDVAGLKTLEGVARDISELRKRVAALADAKTQALTHTASFQEELIHAQAQVAKIKTDLEKEKGRRVAAEILASRHASRIARMEHEAEVENEVAVARITGGNRQYSQKISHLFRAVRKRYKRPPLVRGRPARICLEHVVQDFTHEEYCGLGMLVAALAVHNLTAVVYAERTCRDVRGFNDLDNLKFATWLR